ncbi:MAG: Cystatin domain protein [Planctomycetes bacterium ADurb.Bin126]|nr:MAG: Cystatin domain protein [Planctomycetes bacterium ADurb.Bin126]HOD84624.1 cystatin domain-containing protein [Phycisphaerae bacterium]HQL76200.1 cystatin domain-containing protein [Phycisphaerae bacterium]
MNWKLTLVATLCLFPGRLPAQPALAPRTGAASPAPVNDKDVVRAAEFAVAEAARKGDKLALVKIVSARKQVVAGMNYILTLHVRQGRTLQTVEAKVWERPWLKEIKLTEWKVTGRQALEGGSVENAPPGKDAPADTKSSFDCVADFSEENNPAGAWTYGYLDEGDVFHAYTDHGKFGGTSRTAYVQWSEKDPKHRGTDILLNTDAVPPNGPLYPTRELVLGVNMANAAGDSPVLRWTAPRDGVVRISGAVTGLKVSTRGMPGVRHPNEVFLTRGTVTIVSGKKEWLSIPLNQKAGAKVAPNAAPIACSGEVKAGDSVDFVFETDQKDVCGACLKVVVAYAEPAANTPARK